AAPTSAERPAATRRTGRPKTDNMAGVSFLATYRGASVTPGKAESNDRSLMPMTGLVRQTSGERRSASSRFRRGASERLRDVAAHCHDPTLMAQTKLVNGRHEPFVEFGFPSSCAACTTSTTLTSGEVLHLM